MRASQVVLATGAHERPLVFANNDRPGIMLAGAVRTYLNRYAASAGTNVTVAATNDSAYQLVEDLHAAGIGVAAVSRGLAAEQLLNTTSQHFSAPACKSRHPFVCRGTKNRQQQIDKNQPNDYVKNCGVEESHSGLL